MVFTFSIDQSLSALPVLPCIVAAAEQLETNRAGKLPARGSRSAAKKPFNAT